MGIAKLQPAGHWGATRDRLSSVTDALVNIAQQHLAGVGMKVDYVWNLDALRKFDRRLAGAYCDKCIARTLPTADEFETADYAVNRKGTIAKWQAYTSVNWSRGKWRGTRGWPFIPPRRM